MKSILDCAEMQKEVDADDAISANFLCLLIFWVCIIFFCMNLHIFATKKSGLCRLWDCVQSSLPWQTIMKTCYGKVKMERSHRSIYK